MVNNKLIEWIEGLFKCLAILAYYGNGKTTMIKKAVDYANPKRVLWVTYRTSLADDIVKNFEDYGFQHYQDGNFKADRLVCQIESLPKIMQAYGDQYEPFEWVVLDEIERILKHFDSSTLKQFQRSIFELLYGFCMSADRVIGLDGDFGNRGYTFLSAISATIVIENLYKPNPKTYFMIDDFQYFERTFYNNVKMNKRCCLSSMTATYADKTNKRLKDMGFKSAVYTSKTGDDERADLKDVNKNWEPYQVVSHSTSLEAGVDYSKRAFDYLFGVLCANTATPIGFMQMTHRIRKYNSDQVFIYTNGMRYMKGNY